jgi:WS/DGAT/MGAT family acyltransferase
VRFKDVLNHFTTRMAQFPQFRRRLVSLPFSLDRPYWIEAAGIDVEFHVRHIALPHPGDWRQLCIQVARLHSRPLDRSKPLWEAYVIEGLQNVDGLPPGSFALYTKMHHAIVDGESGIEIMKALHSLTPEPIDFDAEDAQRVFHVDRDPTLVELYSRALAHNVQRLPNFARFSLGTARKVAALGAEAMTKFNNLGQGGLVSNVRALLTGDLSTLLPRLPPQTRFSGNVSAHRVFEAVTLPLTGFRDIRKQVPKATINDQFLCVVGGALHAYLSAKNELPDASMVAMVPMSLRGADKGGDVGNQVGFTLMPVHSEIEDPLERLRAICEAAQTAKRVTNAVGKELARDLLETLPSIVADPLLRNAKLPKLSLIVSNVRGPDVPLYMAGARLVNYAPISIALDGMGLNVTAFSYAGNMWLCAVSCRDMLPDPAFFAQCLRDAFAKMRDAAAREAAFTVAETAALAATTDDGTPAATIEGKVVRGKAARQSSPRRARLKVAPAKEPFVDAEPVVKKASRKRARKAADTGAGARRTRKPAAGAADATA